MSLDNSLRTGSNLKRHRNVLTRAERLERLLQQDKWNEEKGVFGMPKVSNRKASVGGKTKKKTDEEES